MILLQDFSVCLFLPSKRIHIADLVWVVLCIPFSDYSGSLLGAGSTPRHVHIAGITGNYQSRTVR